MNLTGSFIKKVVSLRPSTGRGINFSITNSIGVADTYFPVSYKTEQIETVFELASFVWIIGIVGAILAVAICTVTRSSTYEKTWLKIKNGKLIFEKPTYGFAIILQRICGNNMIGYIIKKH